MILSHKDTLKLSSPQVDEFIIKSTNGRVHSIGDTLKLLSPQVDEFMIKSTSGQVRPIGIP